MRLVSAGVPTLFENAIVGRVTKEHLARSLRSDKVLVLDVLPPAEELGGYRGCLTLSKLTTGTFPVPVVHSAREIGYLENGDIVVMEPKSGTVRTLFRPHSRHNILFVTERCNSNCLMCSQPPQDRDDVDPLLDRNLQLIDLMEPKPDQLVITGGEPTLLGDRLFQLIVALRDKLPNTYIHMLSNGRAFAWPSYTRQFAGIQHPAFMVGVPVYSDDPSTHDHVVQAKGAFDQTIMGLHQLARCGVRIEIRIVLHALTIPRLYHLVEYIYRNLTFAEHIALMGLENIGYTPRNMQQLWIDPYDYRGELEKAVEFLNIRGMNVSIYNHQLCVLPRSVWKFARKSISDWKNIYIQECDKCTAKEECGGLFKWADKVHSAHIHTI